MRPREERGIALADYFQMLWERRRLILGVIAATTVVAFLTRPPTPQSFYRAQVTLQVKILSVTGQGTNSGGTSGVPPAEVEAARNPEVAAQTAHDLGLNDDGVGLLERLEVSSVDNTDLIQIALTGRGATTVAQLQQYTKNYVEYRNKLDEERLSRALADIDQNIGAVKTRLNQLSQQLGRLNSQGRPEPLDLQVQINAATDIYKNFLELREQVSLDSVLAGNTVQQIGSPIAQKLGTLPTRTLRLLAGPIVGLLLGCALAIALGVLRPRVSSRERTEERLGYPILATIPLVKGHGIARDPLLIQRSSAWGLEGVRMLQTELQLVEKRGDRVRTVVIASPEAGDGRTTLAVNLAASYAAAGRSVALLRADRVAEIDEEPLAHGIDTGPLETVQVRIHRDGFAEVVPRIVRTKNKPGLIGDALTGVFEDLAGDFDVVVVDTRPMSASADSLLLAGHSDAVVLVLRQHKTSEARAIETIDILDRHDVAIVGVALNAVRTPLVDRYRARSSPAAREQRADRESASRQRRTIADQPPVSRPGSQAEHPPRSVVLREEPRKDTGTNGETRERVQLFPD